jgi:hypothetical protein
MQSMVRRLSFVGANGGLRTVLISLPMAEPLLDGQRYFRPSESPETPGARFHMSKPSPERLTRALHTATPRAPTLRAMVKLVLKCDSAEELGRKLRQRYARPSARQRAEDDAELEWLIGKR